jgi:hypothetical protein
MTDVTTLVALLVAVTDTPGINAPVASDTDPLSDALLDCPNDSGEKPRHSTNTVVPTTNVEDFRGCIFPSQFSEVAQSGNAVLTCRDKTFVLSVGGIKSRRATDV